MMVDAHLYGGAVVRLTTRAHLTTLVRRDVATIEELRAIPCWLDRHNGDGFRPARLQFIKKATITRVEQVDLAERDQWLAEYAPDVLADIRAKEAARAAGAEPATTTGVAA